MGIEKNEMQNDNVADTMEDILGIKDTEENTEPSGDETPSSTEETESSEQNPQDKKEEENQTPAVKTTSLTDEQLNIQKDITKIDLQIEELGKKTVDTEEFFNNIDTHLTEDEQALEFEDKSKYMKLVNEKLLEFQKNNSSDAEVEKLKEQKEELQKVYDRQSAIVAVAAKYPQFDYEKVHDFFTNELSKKEQDNIYSDSKSYEDVYELAYKQYVEKNPKNIHQEKAPNIPDVSKITRTEPKPKDTDDNITPEDEKLKSALGLD